MRNELVISTPPANAPLALRKKLTNGAEEQKWLSGADELFAWMGRHQDEKESWWRAQSATIALLKQAHHSLAKAQDRMSEQAERIALLETLATTDELTGLMNRRGFMEQFSREIDRTSRDQSEGGLLMLIDLDNFKSINDTHGHAAGDAALKLAAGTLAADIRTMDCVGRLGGDEFVVLLANTDRKKAALRAQGIVKKLNSLSLIWNGIEIPVRASLGLKEYKKGDTTTRIFGDADDAMYAQKLENKLLQQKEA